MKKRRVIRRSKKPSAFSKVRNWLRRNSFWIGFVLGVMATIAVRG